MDEKNRVKLKICGSEFIVIADEDKEYIRKTAKIVDTRVKELLKENDKFSFNMATIVAALNYLDELQKEKEITNILRESTEKNEAIAKKAVAENIILKEENAKLLEEKLGLHKRIEELKLENPTTEPAQAKINQAPAPTAPMPTAPAQGTKTTVQSPLKAWAQSQAKQAPIIETEAKPRVEPSGKNTKLPSHNTLFGSSKDINQNSKQSQKPGSVKIDYQGNDQIDESFRREEFIDRISDEEMISFFDERS